VGVGAERSDANRLKRAARCQPAYGGPGAPEPQGERGAREVHPRGYVRPGDQRDEARGCREVGRGRVEECVRLGPVHIKSAMADQRIEPILAESASPGASAIPAPVVVVAVPKLGRPRRFGQLLEREHILAGVLLAPTLIILTLFIAYPFVL